jgi:hypothetical protein
MKRVAHPRRTGPAPAISSASASRRVDAERRPFHPLKRIGDQLADPAMSLCTGNRLTG